MFKDDFYLTGKQMTLDMLSLLGDNYAVIEDLKAENFDFFLGSAIPSDTLIAKALKIPLMSWSTYLPNPLLGGVLNLPDQSSYDLPIAAPGHYTANNFDFGLFVFKLASIIPRHAIPYLI